MARKHKQLAEHVARGLKDARDAADDAKANDSDADSDAEGGAGIWAQNEEEAVLGPGDEAQVSFQHLHMLCYRTMLLDIVMDSM
jgi:hypothetical protein